MISSKGQFVVRLSEARVNALVTKGTGVRFEPSKGRVMREWLAVTGHQKSWIALAREARKLIT